MSNKVIGVWEDGELEWHLKNAGPTDHVTMCGLDGDDETIGQMIEPNTPKDSKVNCRQCYDYFTGFKMMKLRESDFTDRVKR